MFFPLFRLLFMFLGDFCKLNKTPSDGTCLGEPAGVFCDVSCCCFFISLDVFPSLLFDVIPYTSVSYCWVFTPILYFQPSSSQSDSGYFHLNFSGLFRHSFTASATVSSGCFLLTDVFYLAHLPHISARFCDSDADRNTPSRILLCAYPIRVVPSGWRMVLNYSYCRYKTTGLSVLPVSHNRVKTKLFNMFQPTYPFLKTIKTIWTELVNKYCLELLSLNENAF